MEDDLKQFWAALFGTLRAMAKRAGLAALPRNGHPADPKRLSGGQEPSAGFGKPNLDASLVCLART